MKPPQKQDAQKRTYSHKMLLQMGAELLFRFRHGSGPADAALADFVRTRKFLGSNDRRYLGDVFYHTLRNLRRIDEALLSAFNGLPVVDAHYSTGFPVSHAEMAEAWAGDQKKWSGKGEGDLRQLSSDRCLDTARLGVAAVELKLDTPMTVAEELQRSWPAPKASPGRPMNPMSAETIARMVERAAELAAMFRTPKKPVDAERAYSFPGWLWGSLLDGRDPKDLARLADALLEQSPVALRVNRLKATKPEVLELLKTNGIEAREGTLAPDAVVLSGRVPRSALPRLDDGWIEVQDEGSQLVSLFGGVRPGMIVIDACAGAGGKALHLAALMENTGRVVALDRDSSRLERLAPRARRSGASIIEVLPDPASLPDADLVVVDAPCSGTGTMRRNPEARWRLTSAMVVAVRQAQTELLHQWAGKVRMGGALLYATCSLLAEENEHQVRAFLTAHPEFTLDPPADFPVALRGGMLVLEPHTHGCDGFFAARLRRTR